METKTPASAVDAGAPERFDALVLGAGPAGSSCAYRLARGGASVLLVDKAEFPRDKPCGGALTQRALRQLPFSVEPVVERTVDRLQMRLGYGPSFERTSAQPLIALTQRRRLDHLLVERAVAVGAEFRDGVKVEALEVGERAVTASIAGVAVEAEVLVDAAGANGTATTAIGLRGGHRHGVGLEGNVPNEALPQGRFSDRLILELGAVPGGYGWIFPKGDHVNVGVGGWRQQGPGLREHLIALCGVHGIDPGGLENLRGARLPVRGPRARDVAGRALAIGDAAGLVDPLSGEGMYEALLSARLASTTVLDLLAGESASLEPYERALSDSLAPAWAAAWSARRAVDRYPRATFALARFRPAWGGVVRMLNGEIDHPNEEARRLTRIPLRAIQALGREGRDPGLRPWPSGEPAMQAAAHSPR